MKNLTIRTKLTLWYSVALIGVMVLTFVIIVAVGDIVIQKTIRDSLIQNVEDNVDEVEFFKTKEEMLSSADVDVYIEYNGGFLEIDDDFLDSVNQVYTSLCTSDGSLIYGENPKARQTAEVAFADSTVQTIHISGVKYYIFDCSLRGEGLKGLYLRGIVSEEQGSVQTASVISTSAIILPIAVIIAAIGGYFLSKRLIKPIQDISASAREIRKGGDLKKRIEIGTGDDELHVLADNFNKMFMRLDESFQAEKQFTSDASHELRTPMAVIMSQCELSLGKEQTEEEYIEALQVIYRQGRKMSKLINDMLEFTRMETNSDKYKMETVDLSALVNTVCEDMAIIKEKGILLTYSVENNIVLYGNKPLLTRLLSNLISNAYRYGKQNGLTAVTLSSESNEIRLSVKDNGIGISESDLPKVFKRFYQADSSRDSGTGIGLSMVEQIAKFHGGKTEVTSELGVGSEFVCIFQKNISL